MVISTGDGNAVILFKKCNWYNITISHTYGKARLLRLQKEAKKHSKDSPRQSHNKLVEAVALLKDHIITIITAIMVISTRGPYTVNAKSAPHIISKQRGRVNPDPLTWEQKAKSYMDRAIAVLVEMQRLN